MTGLLRRVIQLPLVLWVIYTVSFVLCELAPGDPLLGRSEKYPPAEVLAARRALHGYDVGAFERYWRWLGQYISGDLGISSSYADRPVSQVLADSLPRSMILGIYGLAIALVGGLLVGVLAAARRNSVWDFGSLAVALVGISLPSFVTAGLLSIVFSVLLGWFAIGGWGERFWGDWYHLTLPSVALALPFVAYISRLARGSMLEVLQEDFIRTARAKGAGTAKVLFKHALRPASLPVVSFMGPAAAAILTGSFVVEKVFQLPGMGDHFVQAVLDRDRRLILSVVIIYSTLLVVFNLLVDVAYGVLDPRIRDSHKG